jgi:hypothetical protein
MSDTPDTPIPIILPPSTYTSDLDSYLTEHLQWYGPGKLHPTNAGDRLHDGRYTILLKLDHSTQWLCWLARDEHTHTWKRIDIVHASETVTEHHLHAVDSQLAERAALQDNKKADEQGLAVDKFFVHGPNGTHLCMVFPLDGAMNCFRCGALDESQMNAAWFVRHCAKLRGGDEPVGGVDAITQDEMIDILGRPRAIEVTPELRRLGHVADDIRDDQLPRQLLLRPDELDDDIGYWLSAQSFGRL